MREKTILEQEINRGDFNSGGEASSKLKGILRKLGIDSLIIRRVSIVTYELEMNVIIHSEGGIIKVVIDDSVIKVLVDDTGPGIKDLDKALKPGYSTATAEIRELGFGAGMGLNNAKKYSDQLSIDTEPGKGTSVEAVIKIKGCKTQDE